VLYKDDLKLNLYRPGLLHLAQRGRVTVLLYNGPLFCGYNVLIKGLSCASRELQKYAAYCYQRWVSSNFNGPAQLMSWCKKANCFGKRGFQQERWRHARIPQPSPWRNVWRKHLFGVLRRMEAKRKLYKKKIFGDLRHLKYGYGGEWWKFHGLSTKNEEILELVETEKEIMVHR